MDFNKLGPGVPPYPAIPASRKHGGGSGGVDNGGGSGGIGGGSGDVRQGRARNVHFNSAGLAHDPAHRATAEHIVVATM